MTAPAATQDHERTDRSQGVKSGPVRAVTGYLRRNRSLVVGLALLLGIIAFAVIGGSTGGSAKRAPAFGARIAASVLGVAFRQRPARPQPVRGHHHAARC